MNLLNGLWSGLLFGHAQGLLRPNQGIPVLLSGINVDTSVHNAMFMNDTMLAAD